MADSQMTEDYRSGPPRSKHIDEEKLRIQREARQRIPYLLEHGSEEEFVAYVKSWKKGKISREDLKEWIKLFHACRAEKRGL